MSWHCLCAYSLRTEVPPRPRFPPRRGLSLLSQPNTAACLPRLPAHLGEELVIGRRDVSPNEQYISREHVAVRRVCVCRKEAGAPLAAPSGFCSTCRVLSVRLLSEKLTTCLAIRRLVRPGFRFLSSPA